MASKREIVERLRSEVPWACKASTWAEVQYPVALSGETAAVLPKKIIDHNSRPTSEIFTAEEVNQSLVWIVTLKATGVQFLVNNEGYLYARYAAKICKAF